MLLYKGLFIALTSSEVAGHLGPLASLAEESSQLAARILTLAIVVLTAGQVIHLTIRWVGLLGRHRPNMTKRIPERPRAIVTRLTLAACLEMRFLAWHGRLAHEFQGHLAPEFGISTAETAVILTGRMSVPLCKRAVRGVVFFVYTRFGMFVL
jgi:hypothetical protein